MTVVGVWGVKMLTSTKKNFPRHALELNLPLNYCVCMCVCVPYVRVCTNEWILLLSLSTDSRSTLALQKQNTRESILREIFKLGENFRGLVTSNVFALSF